jgi:hypothetical protein
MRRVLFRMGTIVLACLTILLPAKAASVRAMALDSLIDHSDYVIYGRVIQSRCVWDPATRTIWTQTEFQVLDWPKGNTQNTIVVTEPGGVIGEVGHLFPGVPKFNAGPEWVLFLYNAPGKRLRATGLTQGVYSVVIDPISQERVVRSSLQGLEVVRDSGVQPSYLQIQNTAGQRLNTFLKDIRQKASSR